MNRFQGTFFELQYPDSWEVEIIENIPCFFDPDGVGALQVAAFRQPDAEPFDLLDEMAVYLERQKVVVDQDQLAIFDLPGELQAAACEFLKDDRFWMINCIVKTDRMLFLLWNSDVVPDTDTAEMIGSCVTSVRFYE